MSSDEAAAPAGIRRNVLLALAAQVTTGLFTAGLTLYLVRHFGPTSFGVFALALGMGEIAFRIADLGIPFSTSRFLAERRRDGSAVAALLSDALRLKLVTSVAVAGALFAGAGLIASVYEKPALLWPLRAVAIAGLGQGVMMLYVTAFIGLGLMAINLRVFFLESLVETTAAAGLVLAGAGVTGATFGRAIGYVAGAAITLVVVWRLYGSRAFRRGTGGTGREIMRYAVPLFITNGTYTVYAQIDTLLVGGILGTTAAGVFSAPLRLVIPLSYVGQAIANAVAPRQARGTGEEPNVAAFQTSLRWVLVFQSALLAPLIVWPRPIVSLLFGQPYTGSVEVLRVLSLFIFLRGAGPLITTTVNYLGRARQRIPIITGALAVNIVVDVTLLPWIGVVGGAVGAGVADLIYVPLHLWICKRELRFPVAPLALTLLRALLAAGAAALVLLAFGTNHLSPGRWLLGATLATVALVTVLVLSGEITPAERRAGVSRVRRGFRKTLGVIRA